MGAQLWQTSYYPIIKCLGLPLIPNKHSLKLIHYFAYGSNLHPARLKQRVPSSQSIGWVELAKYDLRFHKIGIDNSGKCDAFFTGNAHDLLYGVVYSMRADERHLLDTAEGLGNGYNLYETRLLVDARPLKVFFYTAESAFINDVLTPYDWYKALVVEGAKFHRLPSTYIQTLQDVSAKEDSNKARTTEHMAILSNSL